MSSDLTCGIHSAAFIYPLRSAVIIAGTGRSSPVFPGDSDPETMHFGGCIDGDLVVCFTIMSQPWEGEEAWRLRGMATHPEHRRRGYAARLLAFAEDHLRATSDRETLWCDARLVAVPFYRATGWRIVSEEFDIAGIGAHYKMLKELSAM